MKLSFDPEKHEYKADNIVIPSVTQILQVAGIIKQAFYKPGSAGRGTAIHEILFLLDEGMISIDTVKEEYRPYAEAWLNFKRELSVEIVESEQVVFHEEMMYGGTFDRLIRVCSSLTLLDIKTGVKEGWHELQLTLYLMAYCEMHKKKLTDISIADLYLSKTGKYKLVPAGPDVNACIGIVNDYRKNQK